MYEFTVSDIWMCWVLMVFVAFISTDYIDKMNITCTLFIENWCIGHITIQCDKENNEKKTPFNGFYFILCCFSSLFFSQFLGSLTFNHHNPHIVYIKLKEEKNNIKLVHVIVPYMEHNHFNDKSEHFSMDFEWKRCRCVFFNSLLWLYDRLNCRDSNTVVFHTWHCIQNTSTFCIHLISFVWVWCTKKRMVIVYGFMFCIRK